jgi:hypothetical protein
MVARICLDGDTFCQKPDIFQAHVAHEQVRCCEERHGQDSYLYLIRHTPVKLSVSTGTPCLV